MQGPTHQAMPRIGDRVDRYEICGEIDSGGMSVVYAVKRFGGIGGWSKLLAMKVILPNLARQERFSRMFMDEARILSLVQHPNLVQVHDVGETEAGLLYMVMELLRGRALSRLIREALKTDGILDRGILLGILADAAEGLHAAHETRLPDGAPAKIVHRDVSPQNIHVGFDGTVKIVDFGIAAAEGRMTETRTGELKGKLSYIAPEQVMRRDVDRRADVWSLGVISWEMLAGRRLFTGENEIETLRNVDGMEIPPIGSLVRGLPPRTADTIMRCLVRDQAQRTPTAAVVASAFREGSRVLATTPGEAAGSIEERRAYVQRLLATEMVIENERLSAAVREGPPPPVRNLSPEEEISDLFSVMVTDDGEPKQPPPPAAPPLPWPARRSVLAGGAAALGLLVGLGAWAIARPGPDASVAAEPVRPAKTRTVGSTEVPAPPAPGRQPEGAGPTAVEAAPAPRAPGTPRVVQLVIDPRLRSVRVDGELATERPVLIAVGDARILVEGIGPQGERVRRIVDANTPDRATLALPRAEPRSEPVKEHGGKSPLLGSPYHRRSP